MNLLNNSQNLQDRKHLISHNGLRYVPSGVNFEPLPSEWWLENWFDDLNMRLEMENYSMNFTAGA